MNFNIKYCNLKYYNKLLIKLNKYSVNHPIIFSNKNFVKYYTCNDLIIDIFTDNINNYLIPGLSELNYIITKFWMDNIKYAYQNVLLNDNCYSITNKLNILNTKFLVFNNNIEKNIKIFKYIKKWNINVNIFDLTNLKSEKYYIVLIDNNSQIIQNFNRDLNFLKNLSLKLFDMASDICKKKNITLDSTLFCYGTKDTKKYYISNNPFSFQNSIYNLKSFPELSQQKNNEFISKILKFYKNITNNLLVKTDFLVEEYHNKNINNIIIDFYLKKREIYFLISNISDLITNKFIEDIKCKQNLIIYLDINYFFSDKIQAICKVNNITIICLLNNDYITNNLNKFNDISNNKIFYSEKKVKTINSKTFNNIDTIINYII